MLNNLFTNWASRSFANVTIAIFISLLTGTALADERPLVIFVLGSGSTDKTVSNWESKARAAYGGKYDFKAYAYPKGCDWRQGAAFSCGGSLVNEITQNLNKNSDRKVIVVSHSSGSGVAMRALEKAKSTDNLEYINLEGFRTTAKLKNSVPTACWTAKNDASRAPNFPGMNQSCDSVHIIKPKSCKGSTCLHFSLVSREGGGYSDMGALNLDWLEHSFPTPETSSQIAVRTTGQP